MVHADGGRGHTWLSPPLPILILHRARRLVIQYQHNGRDKYYCSHRHLRPAVYLDDFSAHHISTIALPEFIFRHYLVPVPDVTSLPIQGPGTRWRIVTCVHKHGSWTDATCDGRAAATHDASGTGASLAA